MSNWQTINKTGSILINDNLQNAPNIRNVRKFLKETSISFTKQCVSFYNIVGEFSFISHFINRQHPSTSFLPVEKS